jgi:FeS assembly SUF system protein
MLTKIKDLFKKEEKPGEAELTSTKTSEEVKASTNTNGEVKENNTEKSESVETRSEEVKSESTDVEKTDQPTDDAPKHSLEEIKDEVIKVLKTCYDPEIPVDVWELGLIYEINAATNGDVLIVMTLTSPSCPVAEILPVEIEKKVKEHPMINDCKVKLTFDPPWSQKNMSEVAMLELGFL